MTAHSFQQNKLAPVARLNHTHHLHARTYTNTCTHHPAEISRVLVLHILHNVSLAEEEARAWHTTAIDIAHEYTRMQHHSVSGTLQRPT
jgi:hypothetical protein